MDIVIAWGAQTWATLAAWATLVLIGASALYARRQVRETRVLREEQIRPFVVVDFETESLLVTLVIQNLGSVLARNIALKFEPELETTLGGRAIATAPAFVDGIPTLPPRKRIRFHFDQYINRRDQNLPMRYMVTLAYEGPTGRRYGPESYVLDLEHLEGSAQNEDPIKQIAKRLKGIEGELKKWTDGLHGIRVIDRTESKVNAEHERRDREENAEGDVT